MRTIMLAFLSLTSYAQAQPINVPVCGVTRTIDKNYEGFCTRIYFQVGSRRFSGLLFVMDRNIGKAKVMIDDYDNSILDTVVISTRQIYKKEWANCYNQ